MMGDQSDLERMLKTEAQRAARLAQDITGQDAVVQTYGEHSEKGMMGRFADQVVQALDQIAAEMGISQDNAHEHDLRRWVAPDGRWHYSIDGELVLIADPQTRFIEGRIAPKGT